MIENVFEKEKQIADENKNAYKESLLLIYNFFHKESAKIKERQTGDALYDAVACLCSKMKISIVDFKTLVQTAGEDYSVDDIARLSHFPTRQVVLEEGWYKKDCGSLLAWLKDAEGGESPVVCLPSGISGYMWYDPSCGESGGIDHKFAQKLNPMAQMIYSPFPNEKIGIKELILFGWQNVKRVDICSFLGLSLVVTLIGLLLPYLTQLIYDKYIGMADVGALVSLCMVILICNLASLCFGIVRNLASFRGFSSIKYAIQAAVYDRLFNLPDAALRENDSTEMGFFVTGISTIFSLIQNVIFSTVFTALFSLAYIWVMVNYSPDLAAYGIGMLLLAFVVIYPLIRLQKRYARKQTQAAGSVTSISYQLIDGVAKLKVAGAENKAMLEYLKPYQEMKYYQTNVSKITQWVSVLKIFFTTISSMVFYYLAVVHLQELSMGSLMGFLSAFGSLSGAFFLMLEAAAQISNISAMWEKAKIVLETLPDYNEAGKVPNDLQGEIEVSHVDFSYSAEGDMVLQDFSLHVKPGEYIGIVGSSGCGKSTLLKLLLGMERPSNGKIYYDNYDMETLDKRELRKKMGVVLQNGKVFSGSIYENITFTCPKAGKERVMDAVRAVGLEKDIQAMPMGLHTYLAEGGGTLSGGQQQRILIARAIIGKPKIILFDEATSALDNVVQEMVCESLEQLNATRIVIAHRLSTIINCDRILVMDKGRFVEEGTYDELMERKGLFYRLASRQVG